MSEEQPLQLPEGVTDEEIAAAVVVAALARRKAALQESQPSREAADRKRWIQSNRPDAPRDWRHSLR